MENTLCGPSNSLETFKNHISVDRTLQQDRIGDSRPPAEGFRSSSATAGVLDLEFQAFQSGHSLQPGITGQYQTFQSTHNLQPGVIQHETFISHNFESEQVGLQTSSWAADFQNAQQASFNAAATMQAQYREQRSGVNFNHFESHNRTYATPPINRNRFEGRNIHYATPPIHLQNSKNPRIVDVSDDASFEQAFDAASADLRDEEAHGLRDTTECGRNSLVFDPAEELPQIDAHPFLYTSIESDQIINEAHGKEHQQFGVNNEDELARTAGELLDTVKHEHSAKFRESKFLSFMGQLRDRKVRIEGDKVVDAVQSLHPGGAFYPDETQHEYDSIHGTYKKDVENLLTDAELKEVFDTF